MTTYVQVEAARRAYNELAAGCGRGEIPLGANGARRRVLP